MRVTLVAAVGRNGVIGRDGALPWGRTGDLAHFKRVTMGHTLVMGRRTFESVGRALPGRSSVVLTRSQGWSATGVRTVASMEEALRCAGEIESVSSAPGGEVFVIGGGQVYAQAMPHADRLLITQVDQDPEGDTWFPPIDPGRWCESDRTAHDGFDIVTFDRFDASRLACRDFVSTC